MVLRTEREHVREDAGAAVPDQQMRSAVSKYPVDRYLVDSSNNFEMVNIIDDDIWNTEPALKPEDEIILMRLHGMLQSTADDLKLLSGELSKFHEPGVQVKTAPTPLDEEFNEKVHIEEIVNAKFHGYKIIDKSHSSVPENKSSKDVTDCIKPTVNLQKTKTTNADFPVNTRPATKKPLNRNLGITRTKVIQINGNENGTKTEMLNNGKVINAPAVSYNEYSFKYVEPKLKTPRKDLQIQEMPSINIRSELREQKVLQLDIIPEIKQSGKAEMVTKNVAVVAIQHETPKPNLYVPTTSLPTTSQNVTPQQVINAPTKRKVSKMSTCESSASSNNISSDTQIKLKTQQRIITNIRSSPKSSARSERNKLNNKRAPEKRPKANLDEWRKKLNSVYGPSVTKKSNSYKTKSKAKVSPKKTNIPQNTSSNSKKLSNIEYIPYSKLTVGGARASDIEREISNIPNRQDIPLSPILDRILSSRENSFSKNCSEIPKPDGLNVLTTSDENLLQEVIDIERTVSETLSKKIKNADGNMNTQKISSESDEVKENDSYADDFEDEKSDRSGQSGNQKTNSTHSNDEQKFSDEDNYNTESDGTDDADQIVDHEPIPSTSNTNIQNLTYTKISNLSYKNSVDIFEFVHSIEMQDSATQSNTGQKISPKETQTSPSNEKNIQPIHNDLWPDPKGEVEKMFQLEKEFIKKLIVEEYGDLLEKNIHKPSTSNEVDSRKNISASQKNTQTSPAHVKNVMTSPTQTKTRTTSPFPRLTVEHHTSPLIFVTNEEEDRLEIENDDDPGISINLSSPRFSLRLPRTSREVLSNLEDSVPRSEKKPNTKTVVPNTKTVKSGNKSNVTITSSSSLEADSSEISSLGEVRLWRKLAKTRILSDTDSVTSCSSRSDFLSGILPLRSEGEMSLGRNRKSKKHNKSEGEASFGML